MKTIFSLLIACLFVLGNTEPRDSILISCSVDYENGMVIFHRTGPLDIQLEFSADINNGEHTFRNLFEVFEEYHYSRFEIITNKEKLLIRPGSTLKLNPHHPVNWINAVCRPPNPSYSIDSTIVTIDGSKLKKSYALKQAPHLKLYNDTIHKRIVVQREWGDSRTFCSFKLLVKNEIGAKKQVYSYVDIGKLSAEIPYVDFPFTQTGTYSISLIPLAKRNSEPAKYSVDTSVVSLQYREPARHLQPILSLEKEGDKLFIRSDRPLPQTVKINIQEYSDGRWYSRRSVYLERRESSYPFCLRLNPDSVDRSWQIPDSRYYVVKPGYGTVTVIAGQILAEREAAKRIAEERRIEQAVQDSLAKVEAARKQLKNAQARRRERFKIEEWHVIVILLVLFTWITVPTTVVIPKVDPITGKKIPTKVYLQEAPLFLWLLLLIYVALFLFALLTIFHDAGLITLPQLVLDTMMIFLIFIPIGVAVLALGGTIFGREYRKVFASILITDLVVVTLGVLAAIMAIGAIGI